MAPVHTRLSFNSAGISELTLALAVSPHDRRLLPRREAAATLLVVTRPGFFVAKELAP